MNYILPNFITDYWFPPTEPTNETKQKFQEIIKNIEHQRIILLKKKSIQGI